VRLKKDTFVTFSFEPAWRLAGTPTIVVRSREDASQFLNQYARCRPASRDSILRRPVTTSTHDNQRGIHDQYQSKFRQTGPDAVNQRQSPDQQPIAQGRAFRLRLFCTDRTGPNISLVARILTTRCDRSRRLDGGQPIP
jgi:hypothetical protein